jgi:hypothetical protein
MRHYIFDIIYNVLCDEITNKTEGKGEVILLNTKNEFVP